MNLSSLGIDSAVYINDGLCTYQKMFQGKCRKFLSDKYIHSFWMTNGTIKLKTVENGRVYAVTHQNDLMELFPDNDVSADQVQVARLFFFLSYVAFVFQISSLSLFFQFPFSSYMFRINSKQHPIQPFLFFRVGLFMTMLLYL